MLKRKILAILTAGVIVSGMSLHVLTTHADEITDVEQVITLVDKSQLQDCINFSQVDPECVNVDMQSLKGETYALALANAKDILNADVPQMLVNRTLTQLQIAVDFINFSSNQENESIVSDEDSLLKVDKSELQDFIAFAETYGNYPEGTWGWDLYRHYLNEAKNILDNTNVEQIDFDVAFNHLNDALVDGISENL